MSVTCYTQARVPGDGDDFQDYFTHAQGITSRNTAGFLCFKEPPDWDYCWAVSSSTGQSWGVGCRVSLGGGVTQVTHTLPCSFGPASQVNQMVEAVRLALGPGQEAPASPPDLT